MAVQTQPKSQAASQPGSDIVEAGAAEGVDQLWFEDPESGAALEIRVEDDTLWMTQRQLSRVFEVSDSTVSHHLKNAAAAEEIDLAQSMRVIREIREEGGRQVARPIRHYDLDAVLAVGYRVSSRRGTRFRRWATAALRERLTRDIEARNRSHGNALWALAGKEFAGAFQLARAALEKAAPGGLTEEARAVLDVVDGYARSFSLLLQYDEDRLPDALSAEGEAPVADLSPEEARAAIRQLKGRLAERGEDTDLFGQERGEGLEAVLGNIEQTFGGVPLYPTWRSRAAHLLYFIIKNHPFSDGNKRIGSFLFLLYIDKQKRLMRPDGRPLVEENGLVAMALLVAESAPAQRDLVLRLILGLISEDGAAKAGAEAPAA